MDHSQLADLLVAKDKELKKTLKCASEQEELQKKINTIQGEVDKQDEEIIKLQRHLKEAEHILVRKYVKILIDIYRILIIVFSSPEFDWYFHFHLFQFDPLLPFHPIINSFISPNILSSFIFNSSSESKLISLSSHITFFLFANNVCFSTNVSFFLLCLTASLLQLKTYCLV
jgi:hypothetical protein